MTDGTLSHSPEPFETQKPKKRRLHGSCDICRKRKIKCDSATMPGNFCSNCQLANIRCTHDLPRQSNKKDAIQAYITYLEERLDRMERYLQFLHPEKDMEQIISIVNEHGQNTSEYAQSRPLPTATVASSRTPFTVLKYPVPPLSSEPLTRPSPESPDTSDDEDIALAEHLEKLSLTTDSLFFGPASGFIFAVSALSLKKEMADVPQVETTPVRRPMFWDMHPWESDFVLAQDPIYVFPEQDLLQSLVSIYFERPNVLLPVIHKPTFLKSLAAGQHLWDSDFGMTVLLVCAMGARYSNDRRVRLAGVDSWMSAGWQWFSQVPMYRNYLLRRTSAYDLQYYCLAVTYLLGTNVSQTTWSFLGLGIRFALEKGIHRRRGKDDAPSAEYEHLKRAFWCLVCIDRIMSSALGRPSSIADEDFDVDYPVECDDEYWETEDPQQAFKQPPGKPCQLSAFIYHIKLLEILAFTLRTLYSTKKSKTLTGLMGVEWEQRLVAELDSSMKKWKDSLPSYLQWQAEMPDSTFFHQSSCLHATYYYIQIQIHRVFLTRSSPLTKTSFTMCTSAAHACCRVLEITTTRGMWPYPNYFMAAFLSGIVLFINLWGVHRTSVPVDQAQETENVQRCFRALTSCEKRWHLAGRLHDKLAELGPSREYRPAAVPKRRRDDPSASSSTSSTTVISTGAPTTWTLSQLPEEAAAQQTKLVQSGYSYSPGPSPGTQTLLSTAGVPHPLIQPQQHFATAEVVPLPQFDMYSSAASMHANDWDFISDMQFQSQQQFGSNPGMAAPAPVLGPTGDMGAFLDSRQRPPHPEPVVHNNNTSHFTQHRGVVIPANGIRGTPLTAPVSYPVAQAFNEMPFPLADDLFSVWSDRPVVSNAEEWEPHLGGRFDHQQH